MPCLASLGTSCPEQKSVAQRFEQTAPSAGERCSLRDLFSDDRRNPAPSFH